MKAACPQAGFTLLEVLVALTIVAIALAACVRAVGLMATNDAALRERSLALLSAQNTLAEFHAQRLYPPIGTSSASCAQGVLALVCESTVAGTANNGFRQITVLVRGERDQAPLAQLRGLATSSP